MAEEKYSKKKFGDTYYPISTNAMTNNRYENFANKNKEYGNESDLDKNHQKLIAKLNKEKVRPSEIAKLDKEYKSRLKQSTKDLQDRLKAKQYNDPNTKKQQSAKAIDTGSTFSTGGQMLKGGQKKLDKNKDGKISGEDFKMMKAKYGKMTKANMGTEVKSTQGYGAARTSGMGLQDEDLIPGKSMDYYKDIV